MEDVLLKYVQRLENIYGAMSHNVFGSAKRIFLEEFQNKKNINAIILGYSNREYVRDDNYYIPTDKDINNEITTELKHLDGNSVAVLKIPFIRSAGRNSNFNIDVQISRDFLFEIVNTIRRNTRIKCLPVLTLGKTNYEVATGVGLMLSRPFLNIFSACHPLLIEELNNTYENLITDSERNAITQLNTYLLYNFRFVFNIFIKSVEISPGGPTTQSEYTSHYS